MIPEKLSFTDFLEKFGEINPPAMKYDGEEAPEAWQIRFMGKVESLRGRLPEPVKTGYEVLQSVQLPGYRRDLLKIKVSAISELIAYLLVPDNIQENEKRPALIASHGHTKFGPDSICGIEGIDTDEDFRRAYGLHAVKSGFVVLAPAWWGWNGRNGHVEKVGGRDKCNVAQMAAGMYGINVLDLHIQDGQAAIDVLQQVPEADPDRIGCIGNSYGGRTTMWLTIFDKRIKACVVSGAMNTFRERSLKMGSCAIQYLPGILKYGDVPELFSLIAPRSMQLQAGTRDPLINDADRDNMKNTVELVYRKMNAAGNLDFCLNDDGHILIWEKAREFLNRHL